MKNISKKKLLIAGGSHAEIPLIFAAKQEGFRVYTTGNCPGDFGHRHADEYIEADYSNFDEILRLAETIGIDAICAGCNDFSALTSAYVAEKLCLPGHDNLETARTIHHKDTFKCFALQNGFRVPRTATFQKVEEALEGKHRISFPAIVKPIDLTGGKGIARVKSEQEYDVAVRNAFAISRAKRIVVEEFIEGTRHAISMFLVKGMVRFYFSDNEHYYLNPYLVSAASAPSIVSHDVEKELCADAERIARLLSLKTGIFHVQFIMRDGKPYIIEICRRAPGDLYVNLVEHATGAEFSRWIVRTSAGMDANDIQQLDTKGFYTRHCIMGNRNGELARIDFNDSIRDQIIDEYIWGQTGTKVEKYLIHKFGIVFVKFHSQQEMLQKTENMQEIIKAHIG